MRRPSWGWREPCCRCCSWRVPGGRWASIARLARAGRALICAVSVLAAAFVLLYAVNPAYLEGIRGCEPQPSEELLGRSTFCACVSGTARTARAVGSVVDTLFTTAVVGAAVFAAVVAALKREDVRVAGAP